jgi:type VI secretion system protein ImpA
VSIRDIEIANGQAQPAEGETQALDLTQLNALLTNIDLEELTTLQKHLQAALASLKSIESVMRDHGGTEAAPDFALLQTPLARTAKLVGDSLAVRAPASSGAPGQADALGSAAANTAGGLGLGNIRSREDATRALDAVADFFRASEPSSPIPLLLERAKRLVAKDFLAVLAELAPEALGQAKAASGVRDE